MPGLWSPLIDVWRSAQISLPSVRCWPSFDPEKNGGIRIQDLLQHSYSLVLLGRIFVSLLRPHLALDEELLLTALLLHDQGKAENGFDTPRPSKSDWTERREYALFFERYGLFPEPIKTALQRAFLLQSALMMTERFPEDARTILNDLRISRPMEILAFDAIERWDFVLYALEQYRERKNDIVLTRVLQHHAGRLDELVNLLPGFGETIWTSEIRAWKNAFLAGIVD